MHPAIRLQHIACACAVLLGLNAAHASVVTTSPLDAGLSGTATLSFNPDLLGALDTGRVSVAPSNPIIQPQVIKDTDGFYSSVSVTAPITSVTYDPSSREIFGVGTSGGLVMTAPALQSVSSGGSLTVTDFGTITSTMYPLLSAPPGPDWHITSVPEPSTYALMGLGLAGLVVAKRRRVA